MSRLAPLLVVSFLAACAGEAGSTGGADNTGSGAATGSTPTGGSTSGNTGGTTGASSGSGSTGSGSTGSGSTGSSGAIGPTGGTVQLLHFGLTGDTRPANCEDIASYPSSVIHSIASSFEKHGADFVLDLGDHMYVCNDSLPLANQMMDLYMQGIAPFQGTWFMTMGNHECMGTPCLPSSTNANYVAFMKKLAPISKLPYYTFDVSTSKGLATFVIIADNAWSSAQATWLESTLARADKNATYTIVARHHPTSDTSITTNADSLAIVERHKFALFLTGHSHEYRHPPSTLGGRTLILGTGGAPLLSTGAFNGYALVDQKGDGNLQISVYDTGDVQQDSWTVGPN